MSVRFCHSGPPRKIEISESAVSESVKKRKGESAKKNHLRGKCNANFRLRSGRPGMNSGSDRSPATRFSAFGSCQAGDSIPSQTGEPSQFLLATHPSRLTFSFLQGARQHPASPLRALCSLRLKFGAWRKPENILPWAMKTARGFLNRGCARGKCFYNV